MKKCLLFGALILLWLPLLAAAQTDVYIYYGSPVGDADTITAGIYDEFEIPVYFQAAGTDTIQSPVMSLAFGINNGYLRNFLPDLCTFEFPFTTWDWAVFWMPNENFRTDEYGNSWDSYTFYAGCDQIGRAHV